MSHFQAEACEGAPSHSEQNLYSNRKALSPASLRRSDLSRRLQPIGEYAYGGSRGYLYSARSYTRTIKSSRAVAIYLSLNDEPLEFIVDGMRHRQRAAVFKPLVARTIVDHGSGLICAVLNPTHPCYRQFSVAQSDKIHFLDRAKFLPLNAAIRDACLGSLDLESGLCLLSQIASTAAAGLPLPEPLDSRIAKAVELLHADASMSFTTLASELGLSYYRLSHLFSQNIGLSLRGYQLWLKLDRIWRLIERGHGVEDIAALAGFSDRAHLCHAFRDAFGVPIVHHLRNLSMKMNFNLA